MADRARPRRDPKVRKIKQQTIRRLLGPEPCETLDKMGLMPAAVETMVRHPQEGAWLRALVCRLYPVTELARIRYVQARVEASEAIVFPDPGDDLELNLLEGFHNAAIVARRVLEQSDYRVKVASATRE